MQSQLPSPDTHTSFKHKSLDALLPFWLGLLSLPTDTIGIRLFINAKVGGSDIKWNDMAGKFAIELFTKATGVLIRPLFSGQLVHFTGNCGIKALSHLWTAYAAGGNKLPLGFDDFKRQCIKIVESFAYYQTNCGMLIGSDTNCVGFKGPTLTLIEGFGENYHISPPTWNPNYTWSKDHNISLFWKDLNSVTHEGGWVQEPKGT